MGIGLVRRGGDFAGGGMGFMVVGVVVRVVISEYM